MDRNKPLIFLFIFLSAIALSFFVVHTRLDTKNIFILIFVLLFIPTLIKPQIGLVVIIISTLFSPDWIVGMTTQREITIRIEDMCLTTVIVAWLIRTALSKDIVQAFRTPLTGPFLLYIVVCIVSSVFAHFFGTIDLRHAFLSILKYLEYFILFLMVKYYIRDFKQTKMYVLIFFLVALVVGIYAHIFVQQQLAAGSTFFMTSPPVDTRAALSAGTLGGYLLFMMCIAGGLLMHMRSLPIRAFLICVLLLMFKGFLYTLSRGSYLAFLPAWFALFFFSKKYTFAYASVIILVIVILLMPSMVRKRITDTVMVKQGIEGEYLELEESPQARVNTWIWVLFTELPDSPIFGHGVGKKFIDGQFFLVLYESGIVGFILFMTVLARLFKMLKGALNTVLLKNDRFSMGLAVGLFVAYIGLLLHAISANTFIIIRIMEPFWFMTAIILALPSLLEKEEARAESSA